ncbi:hypothetical protein DSO57_1024863 [Entomophthora muscae]|uniref:Uncharacterized protein n=1 Tax=Entomophthora muscae TaxID=34485 RepID=A0ACC2S4H5_9FUNG|nr:hypothetical protein DSO57_1024863 [Entomophthora muscae]
MRELEAQLAEVRSEVQEDAIVVRRNSLPCVCLMMDLGRALLYVNQLALPTKMMPSHPPWEDEACHLCLGSLLQKKKLLALIAQSLLQEHHNITSLCVPNKTPLLLQDARTQIKMRSGSTP